MISVPITCSTIAADDHLDAQRRSVTSVLMCSGLIDEQHDGERRRQPDEHPAGDAAVRRDDADLPLHPEPIADDRREVVENLGEVAAGLALRQHGGDEEPRVEQRDPLARSLQRVRQRHAEVLLVVEQLELGADRRRASRRRPSRARS